MLGTVIFSILSIFLLNSVECFPRKEVLEKGTLFDQRLKKYLNLEVNPCDDFYQFACGNWNEIHPIQPYDYEARTFSVAKDKINSELRILFENESQNEISSEDSETSKKEESVEDKVKNLYSACLNYDVTDQNSDQVMKEFMDKLGGFPVLEENWDPSKFDLVKVLGEVLQIYKDILIKLSVFPDDDLNNIVRVQDPVFGLPSENYYNTDEHQEIVGAYKTYLEKLMTLMGAKPEKAKDASEAVFLFESELAGIINDDGGIIITNFTEWESSDEEMKVKLLKIFEIVLGNKYDPNMQFYIQESFFGNLTILIENTPTEVLANYIFSQFLQKSSKYLNKNFLNADLEFARVIDGVKELKPRWKRCVQIVSHNMYFAVGSMYLKKYFRNETIGEINDIIESLKESFIEVLKENIEKYNETISDLSENFVEMQSEIAYPMSFNLDSVVESSYKDLEIDSQHFFQSMMNVKKNMVKKHFSVLTKPIQDTIWFFELKSFDVEAWYILLLNRVIIPAGILQNPFYVKENEAYNFASIGMMIGHEIGHAFDKFVITAEEEKDCLIDQYNSYTFEEIARPVDGLKTYGENFADNVGIQIAFYTFQKLMKKAHEKSGESNEVENEIAVDDTYTESQKFFIHFAQSWCSNKRPEAVDNMLMSNVHTPNVYRVIGSLKNFDEFSKAFSCPEGSQMSPETKCNLI